MKGKKVAILLGAVIFLGAGTFINAGGKGTVTLNKDVYAVGEEGATVTVTDGTGGYKAGAGKGFGRVSGSFFGAGTHKLTISDEPSESLNDSGVTVTYPAPQSGEEERSVTAYCTVVRLTADIDGSGTEMIVRNMFRLVNVHISVRGEAIPVGFGNIKVDIYAPKQTGLELWRPAEKVTRYGQPPNYSVNQRFHMSNYFWEDFYKPTRFDVMATYAGIRVTDYTLISYETVFRP